MKKLKVFLTGAMAFAMMMPMAMTGVNAAESNPEDEGYNSQTEVSFDDRNIIPDPDNPTAPDWGVQIPSTVKLTKDNVGSGNGVDISVKMVEMAEDGELTDDKVDVFVKSGNIYKLTDAANKLRYGITYDRSGDIADDVKISDKTTGSDGYLKVAEFKDAKTTAANASVAGTAYLLNTPTKSGQYTDKLTYIVTTNGDTPIE